MTDYRVQFCYKETDGLLNLVEKVFEAESETDALSKVKEYISKAYSHISIKNVLFSSPKRVESSRSTTTVFQKGRVNINLGDVSNIRIGEDYYG